MTTLPLRTGRSAIRECARSLLTGAALLLLFTASGQADPTQYARILPKAPESLLLDTAVAGDRLIAVGERGHVIYSDDQGKSWQQGKVPTTQMLTAVHFVSPEKGWAVGHDGLILFTGDGGENWRLQRDGLAAQQQINLEDRELAHQQVVQLKQALAALEEADEDGREELELALEDAVMDLEDAEYTLEEPVTAPPLMDVWFQDETTGWAVGAFGTLLYTDNGGQSWQYRRDAIDNVDEYHYYGITGDSNSRIFIAGEAGGLYRSADGGTSWEALDSPYEGSWFGLLHTSDPELLLIYGLQGNIYRSTDFGDSWQQVDNPNSMSLAGGALFDTGAVVLVGGVGSVLHSEDGGKTFKAEMQDDRLNLNTVLAAHDQLFVAGQGGIRPLVLK